MSRLIALFVLLACSLYGAGICQCPPSIFGTIDGISLPSSSFIVTPAGQGYNISADVTDSSKPFHFTLNVTTQADPAIDFGLSITGDPTVSLVIIQNFLGGPFSNLVSSGSSIVTDLNNDGQVSLTGSPFIKTTVTGTGINGSLVNQLGTNCTVPNATCVATPQGGQAALLGSGPISSFEIPHGTMEMDITFSLSNGDSATVTGNSTLSAAPEPATDVLFAAGLLTGLAFLRRKRAARVF